jgi:hypothetical protein
MCKEEEKLRRTLKTPKLKTFEVQTILTSTRMAVKNVSYCP